MPTKLGREPGEELVLTPEEGAAADASYQKYVDAKKATAPPAKPLSEEARPADETPTGHRPEVK